MFELFDVELEDIEDDVEHLSCPSYPNCDIDPMGCRVQYGNPEEYGHRE